MKTYRVPGTATEWSPSGVPQTATRIETVSSSSNSYSVPVYASLKGETSRKGIRRVVLQVGATIPGTMLNDLETGINVDPKGQTPVSVHIVFQGPSLAFMHEAGQNTQSGFLNLVLGRLTSDLVAMVTNESPSANADNKTLTGLIASALIGSPVLDVISGSYGSTSA